MDIAIDAVQEVLASGVEVELTILENGPERKILEKRVADQGLGEHIRFVGRLPKLEDVYDLMRACDALIHPALNEAFGQAVLENLALGRQVICLDWAGPGMIVTDQCGIKIEPGSRKDVVTGFSRAIASLPARRKGWQEIEQSALERSGEFSWSHLASAVDQAYRDAAFESKTSQ